MMKDLFGIFRQAFPADGSRPFAETADGRTLTYGEMERLSGRCARLFQNLGLAKGDRLLSQVDNAPETLCLYAACLRAGIIYVPANPACQRGELSPLFADAEPRLVVCRSDRERTIGALAGGVPVLTLDAQGEGTLLERSAPLEAAFEGPGATADDAAAILYTSGTTGRPKGAVLTHGLIAWKARAMAETWGWTADDVLLHVMPLCHTHGLFMSLGCVMAAGARILMLPRFETGAVIAHLPWATVFTGVPTMYGRLLAAADFGRETCRNVRLFVSGSAPLLAQTFHAFRERTGHEIVECWGMTETLTNASNPLGGPRRPGRVGRPTPGVELRVVDAKGRPLPDGRTGMIEVRGRQRFPGYWRNPEATGEAIRPDGFFVTGDLGFVDEEGCVAIAGRVKDIIITGGYNVYPREIEAALQAIPGVGEAAVFGAPHPDFGEGVTAAVERAAGGPLPDEASLQRILKRELAGYKVPKRIIVCDALPRSSSGKVRKAALRNRYKDLYGNA